MNLVINIRNKKKNEKKSIVYSNMNQIIVTKK